MPEPRQDAPDPPDARERKAFLLRLSPELYAQLREWAEQDLRSLNAHIEFLLRDALKRRAGGKSSR